MKFVSWNVNGLRACIQKGFLEQFDRFDADFFCLQETKLSEHQLELDLPGYEQYWCYAEKKGYSGTAIFTKHTPMSVQYGLGVPELDTEGRLITLEYPEFYLVTCYTPNAQRELARIDHRMKWDDAFREYLQKLDAVKPVIICGDLNVAHQEIDLKNPKSNRGSAGFSDQERSSFQNTLDLGFTDTFRHLHPDRTDAYSWWSYMFKAREKNAGWRIDYFLVSDRLKDAIYRAEIHSDVMGSDHCPVSVELGLICNGGIWSPLSQGSARQTFPAEKEEKSKPDKEKASAKTAKALFALGLVAMVLVSVFLFWDPPGTPMPTITEKPFTVHAFPQQLSHVALTDNPLVSFIELSENALTDGTNTYYCPIGVEYGSLGNFCLCVDASYAYEHRYGQAMTISVEAIDPSPSTVYAIMHRQYFTDEKYTQFDGWLVFGTLNTKTDFLITVTAGDATFTQTVSIQPIAQETVPDVPNAFTVTTLTEPLYDALIDKNLYRITNESGTIETYAKEIYTPLSITSSYIDFDHNLSDWNSWFIVTLSSEAKELLKDYDLVLNATIPTYGFDSFPSRVLYTSEIYTDETCQDLYGWLVYGNLDLTSRVYFHLTNAGSTSLLPIWSFVVDAAPYLSRKDAAAMSTEDLFRYASKHAGVQNHLALGNSILDLQGRYLFIDVLLDRPDAISTLMYSNLDEYAEKLFARQLLEGFFLQDMTPRQEAILLIGDHPTSPFPYTPLEIDPPDLSQINTTDLLRTALNFYDYSILSQCSSQETAYQILQYWLPNPYWAELKSRSDTIHVLARLYVQDVRYGSLLSLWNYLPARVQASRMTASQLVDFILADPDRCTSITEAGSSLKTYAYSDPYLSALLEQGDAIDALLDVTVPADGEARKVPTILLYNLLSGQMTPQQAAELITGLHNSATTTFTFSLNYPYDLAETPTGHLVSHLTHYGEELFGFLDAAYAYPDPDTVMYEVYQLLLPYSDILQELQTRPDTIADLRSEFVNTVVMTSPVGYLLRLYEYYPVIWDSNIPAFNALAFKDASTWFVDPNAATDDHLFLQKSFHPFTIKRVDYTQPLEDANFAYLVTFPTQYMTKDAQSELNLSISVQQPGELPADSFVNCIPCYMDFRCTKFCGWLVYGKIELDAPIQLTLYRDGSFLTACHFSPLEAPENVEGVRFDFIYDDIIVIPE